MYNTKIAWNIIFKKLSYIFGRKNCETGNIGAKNTQIILICVIIFTPIFDL